MRKKLLIFDFDGVIVKSMRLSYGINKSMAPDLKYTEWQSWFDGNLYEGIRKEFADDASDKLFISHYQKGIKKIKPVPGIINIIKGLKKRYILLIVTSASQEVVKDYLQKNSIVTEFQEILGMETHKSKVDKFGIILKSYKTDPKNVVLITDTTGDILEAAKVKIRSIAVTWGVHSKSRLINAKPSFIADQPEEILDGVSLVLGY